jgi:hypothetical protein
MRPRTVLLTLPIVLAAWGVLLAQKPWEEYPGEDRVPTPPDWNVPHDWSTARLMYREYGGFRRGFGSGAWAIDYPGGDRNLIEGVRRLTRIDVRSVEQAVELDGSDDVFNWPFLYVVEPGQWELDEQEAHQLRDFLDRGGFLMADDFHGLQQWSIFRDGIDKVFPDREIEDLPQEDPIFHMLSDVDLTVQVPGLAALYRGRTYEQPDDPFPRWRGIRDAKGRIIVAICHNMDLGDAWEYSDDPGYPEELASTAHRVLVNYATYDLSH